MRETAFRTCPLCEATCGLEVTIEAGRIARIRGDTADVFSAGFICPKGSTLGHLHEDPDRLRRPHIRRNGSHAEVDWPEAFAEIEARLRPIIEEHGPAAVGMYAGNPNAHSPAGLLYVRPLAKALGTPNLFSASTVDQMPKHVSSGLMFGHPATIAVPDIDRTDYLLMLGADPVVSNGSLATAPDWPGRMKRIRDRGGRIVVVDPRRTKSAAAADEHLAINPGGDAAWLAALATEILRSGPTPGRLADHAAGLDDLPDLLAPFDAASVESVTGIDPAITRRIAAELAAAPTAVVYGRLGTHATRFGTLASWLTDSLNLITGNLDRPGGAMFPTAAHERRRKRPFRTGRRHSRVGGHPELLGEFPASAMAEEMTTEGEGRIRAFITVAGNPVLSTPDGPALSRALSGLEFMVSVDPYLNETTRHADVILPPPSPLTRSQYDLAFYGLSVRNVVNYTPPTLPLDGAGMEEWEILLRLAAIASGAGADQDPMPFDDWGLAAQIQSEIADPASPIAGRDPEEIMREVSKRRGPDRAIDYLIRSGPYGDHFGAVPDGLTLDRLEDQPHGIDLGPLEPRLPDLLSTESGLIEAAPEWITADLPALRASLDDSAPPLVLIGRRDLRSNNSWMHNLDILLRGKERCTLQMHSSDAAAVGIEDGSSAEIRSANGSVTAPVDVTDAIRPGVVSLPHGWGHGLEGTRLSTAGTRPGVNANALTGSALDPVSGNAVLNGIAVEVLPV